MSLQPTSSRSPRDSVISGSERASNDVDMFQPARTSCSLLTRSSCVLGGAYFADIDFRARFLWAESGDVPKVLRFLSPPPYEETETLVDNSRSVRSFLLYSSLFLTASRCSTRSMSLFFQREKQFLMRTPRYLKRVAFSLASAVHRDPFSLSDLPSSTFASSVATIPLSSSVVAERSSCWGAGIVNENS